MTAMSFQMKHFFFFLQSFSQMGSVRRRMKGLTVHCWLTLARFSLAQPCLSCKTEPTQAKTGPFQGTVCTHKLEHTGQIRQNKPPTPRALSWYCSNVRFMNTSFFQCTNQTESVQEVYLELDKQVCKMDSHSFIPLSL